MVSKRAGIGSIVLVGFGVASRSVLKDTRLRALMILDRPGGLRHVSETICNLSANKILQDDSARAGKSQSYGGRSQDLLIDTSLGPRWACIGICLMLENDQRNFFAVICKLPNEAEGRNDHMTVQ